MLTLQAPGKRLLLHCCCAPCAGAIVECLVRNGIRPVLFFSNSNIVPREEYELRKTELVRYAGKWGLETVDDDYDHEAWLSAALELTGCDEERSRELARMDERRDRCLNCFRFRLERAARYAVENGFDTLATTLASSRWKDLAQVDEAGERAVALAGPGLVWWKQNWRKGGLQPRRSEIIREENFYNQNFCGCEFSKANSASVVPDDKK